MDISKLSVMELQRLNEAEGLALSKTLFAPINPRCPSHPRQRHDLENFHPCTRHVEMRVILAE